jgi:hypothetical protein
MEHTLAQPTVVDRIHLRWKLQPEHGDGQGLNDVD